MLSRQQISKWVNDLDYSNSKDVKIAIIIEILQDLHLTDCEDKDSLKSEIVSMLKDL